VSEFAISMLEQMIAISVQAFPMLDGIFATMDQALPMFCDGLAIARLIFSIPRWSVFILIQRLTIPAVHFLDFCSVVDISYADLANIHEDIANTWSNLSVGSGVADALPWTAGISTASLEIGRCRELQARRLRSQGRARPKWEISAPRP
jgi:hypothetical protein